MIPSASGLPFDDIRALVSAMPGPDSEAAAAVRARDATLTKPPGSLGRLEEIAEWLAAWQGRAPPTVNRPLVAVFAGNHGVAAQRRLGLPGGGDARRWWRISPPAAPPSTRSAASTISASRSSTWRSICRPATSRWKPALDEKTCAGTMAYGMEAIADGVDLLAIGEMGIANTTVAAAIYCGLFGGERRATGSAPAPASTTRGSSASATPLPRAIACHAGNLDDPLEVLRRLGGREIAAMAGAILAARLSRVPVIVDGYVASAAAAVLFAMDDDRARPLPVRPCLGRARPPAGAGAHGQAALARPRHAAGGGHRRGAGRRHRQGGRARFTAGMATFEQAGVSNRELARPQPTAAAGFRGPDR